MFPQVAPQPGLHAQKGACSTNTVTGQELWGSPCSIAEPDMESKVQRTHYLMWNWLPSTKSWHSFSGGLGLVKS